MEAAAAGSSRYDFDKAASFSSAKRGGLGAVGERGGWGGGGCVRCERCGEDSGFRSMGCRRWGRWGFHGGRGDGDEVRLGLLESEFLLRLDEIMNKVAEMSGKCAKEVKVVISPCGICPLGAHIDHQNSFIEAERNLAVRSEMREELGADRGGEQGGRPLPNPRDLL
ncbi:hypothetical protein Syun_008846 [Stephania yunnanensis]|uniref:Uncharacterized protein n=1 Tax=Stephania yunnanensis TaxID=152371 RepID=A0AAP0KDK3_9MAGN